MSKDSQKSEFDGFLDRIMLESPGTIQLSTRRRSIGIGLFCYKARTRATDWQSPLFSSYCCRGRSPHQPEVHPQASSPPVHEAVIKTTHAERLVGHISREKPVKTERPEPAPPKRKRGRPRKGEVVVVNKDWNAKPA